MNIILHHDADISVSRFHESGFEIETQDPEAHLGGVHLCMVSLAWCTWSVLASYGQRIDAGVEDVTARLRWRYAEKPHRIGHVDLAIRWPQVPESRIDAAMRAATMCTVHNTLRDGVEIDVSIER